MRTSTPATLEELEAALKLLTERDVMLLHRAGRKLTNYLHSFYLEYKMPCKTANISSHRTPSMRKLLTWPLYLKFMEREGYVRVYENPDGGFLLFTVNIEFTDIEMVEAAYNLEMHMHIGDVPGYRLKTARELTKEPGKPGRPKGSKNKHGYHRKVKPNWSHPNKAALIAAAPALLQWAIEAERHCRKTGVKNSWLQHLTNAIAKAEGR